MSLENVTAATLALVKAAQAAPNEAIAKSVSTATGLVGFDLQAPAKNLYPVITPLRNLLPRVPGSTGVATNWRVVSAIIGSGFNAMPWVPEGQRAGRMSYTTANKAASYVTIGEEDQVTFEAVSAAQTFEDIKATAAVRLLQKMFIKEEDAILGGNVSLLLGTPTAPTTSTATTGGAIAAATYNVIVVALTYEGFRNSSVAGGVATTLTVNGADGNTFTLSGGSSQKSAASSQVTTGATSTISASTPAVSGALGYAWFIGTAGNELLRAITSLNSVVVTTFAGTGTQNASAITADNSRNTTVPAFDGLLPTIMNPSNGAVVVTQPTGVAGTGTPLTASGRGSVVEIDTLLQSMWDQFKVSPSRMWVNSQELKNITNKCLTNASAPLLRYNATGDDNGSSEYRLTASGTIDFYFNPFGLGGGRKIPVQVHPTLPPGTILFTCDDLPAQYQSNNVPNVVEVKTRRDYYQIDWMLRTRQYEMGVYSEEVLAVYAPFAMAVITNIGNG